MTAFGTLWWHNCHLVEVSEAPQTPTELPLAKVDTYLQSPEEPLNPWKQYPLRTEPYTLWHGVCEPPLPQNSHLTDTLI